MSTLVYTNTPIYSRLILFANSKHVLHFLDSLYNYSVKSDNNVSKFTHSNWITLSYYSSPKHKILIPSSQYTYSTPVHYNLEHGLEIITESFSPLNLNYTTSLVKVWIRSDTTSHTIPDAVYLPCVLNWPKLVCAGSNHLLPLMCSTKYYADVSSRTGKSHSDVIGDSKSYLSGLPWLCINVWAYFGGFFWHFLL